MCATHTLSVIPAQPLGALQDVQHSCFPAMEEPPTEVRLHCSNRLILSAWEA